MLNSVGSFGEGSDFCSSCVLECRPDSIPTLVEGIPVRLNRTEFTKKNGTFIQYYICIKCSIFCFRYICSRSSKMFQVPVHVRVEAIHIS